MLEVEEIMKFFLNGLKLKTHKIAGIDSDSNHGIC